MTETKHAILRTRTAHAGWAKLLVATVRLPDGRTITREIEDHGVAVCVLPYDPVRKTAVLVRQFRAPVSFAVGEEEMLEAVAGMLEESDPADCARREAMEEAGLTLDSVEHVFLGWTMPGLSTERMHFYWAVYSGGFKARPGGVVADGEDVTPVEIGLGELADMADRGELADVKTLLLVQTLRLRRPDLFAP
jgi:nudix-type nucleoside diphosphatase (YffH/AdpP family)